MNGGVMDTLKKKYAVVVVTYNRKNLLSENIQALLNQNFEKFDFFRDRNTYCLGNGCYNSVSDLQRFRTTTHSLNEVKKIPFFFKFKASLFYSFISNFLGRFNFNT